MSENVRDKALEAPRAELTPREALLNGWGHGWEERWYIGDDEEPENFTMAECVWIDGHLMDADGSDADADSEYWREHYGKRYGMRIWRGAEMPTEEQRKNTPWA